MTDEELANFEHQCGGCIYRDTMAVLVVEVRRLRAALGNAIELAESGWGYDEVAYFREKWHVEDQLKKLKGVLSNGDK